MLPRIYKSGNTGAPVATGIRTSMWEIINGCLINGYGSQAISSMTHLSDVVTVITSAVHNLISGQVQEISGANEAGYNGTFRVTVTAADTFTYSSTGIVDNTATGTLLTRTPEAGWTIAYTNVANTMFCIRNAGLGFFLQIDSTGTYTYQPTNRAYEYMVDETTTGATGAFGSNNSPKTNNQDNTTPRPWLMIADNKFLYFYCWYDTDIGTIPNEWSRVHSLTFGDFIKHYPSDGYNCVYSSSNGSSETAGSWNYMKAASEATEGSTYFGYFTPRRVDGSGSAVRSPTINGGGPGHSNTPGGGGIPYTTALLYTRPYINDHTAYSLRGFFPGLWYPCHPWSDFTQFTVLPPVDGKTFFTVIGSYGADNNYRHGVCFFQLEDWWT